jgi:hypothetical protein
MLQAELADLVRNPADPRVVLHHGISELGLGYGFVGEIGVRPLAFSLRLPLFLLLVLGKVDGANLIREL